MSRSAHTRESLAGAIILTALLAGIMLASATLLPAGAWAAVIGLN